MRLKYILCIPAYIIYRNSEQYANIQEDIKAFGESSFWKAMANNTCFRSVFYTRCHNEYPMLVKLSKLILRQKKELQIEARESIGGGMSVYHGDSTIVYAQSIGKHFTVYQQVTIGRGKTANGTDVPIIGDCVTVYAGAIIVGGVRIGNHATIGAGAVVVKDVPEYATVVSAPVRIIEHRKEKHDE